MKIGLDPNYRVQMSKTWLKGYLLNTTSLREEEIDEIVGRIESDIFLIQGGYVECTPSIPKEKFNF